MCRYATLDVWSLVRAFDCVLQERKHGGRGSILSESHCMSGIFVDRCNMRERVDVQYTFSSGSVVLLPQKACVRWHCTVWNGGVNLSIFESCFSILSLLYFLFLRVEKSFIKFFCFMMINSKKEIKGGVISYFFQHVSCHLGNVRCDMSKSTSSTSIYRPQYRP